MTKQKRADLLLVMVTAFWGVSYFLVDLCLTDLPPLTLNAFRFLVAFVLLGLVFFRKMKGITRQTLQYSLLVGVFLTAVYVCCTYGVLYTSISNAGFICALPAVTTPVLDFFITGKRPGRRLLVCVCLCTVGLALLTLNEAFQPALGDVICMGVALFYALDLIFTEKAVSQPQVDALQMGVLELGVVGVIMLVLAIFLEQPRLPSAPLFWGSTLFLALFCTGFAFVVQTVQQQYTTASHVGLIFTLEPLFSAVVAYFLADEVLTARGYVGAALMMSSLILMEVLPSKKKSKQN